MRHAGTVLAGQLAVMAFGVADTLIAGRFSSEALAALSVGSAIYISIFIALNGVLQAQLPVWAELRGAGWDAPIYIHGALEKMCQLYAMHGVDLGELRLVSETDKTEMAGQIIVAPPSALNDRWSRRLPDPVTAMASGWMRVRQRARQRMVELPLPGALAD
eukprot:gene8471-10783_t